MKNPPPGKVRFAGVLFHGRQRRSFHRRVSRGRGAFRHHGGERRSVIPLLDESSPPRRRRRAHHLAPRTHRLSGHCARSRRSRDRVRRSNGAWTRRTAAPCCGVCSVASSCAGASAVSWRFGRRQSRCGARRTRNARVLARRLRRELDAVRRFQHRSRPTWSQCRKTAQRCGTTCTASCAPKVRSGSPVRAHRCASISARTTARCWRCSRAASASATSATCAPIRHRSLRARGRWRASTRWYRSRAWLDPDLLRGRKAEELAIWLRAVAERRDARARGPLPQMDLLVAEFRAARAYRPPANPIAESSARRDRRAETLKLLHEWAACEPGALSCRAYSGRASGPGRRATRSRDDLARGTRRSPPPAWNTARRPTARNAARRAVGGTIGREAYTKAQRERVLQTLRYGITVHGSIPTAMQFFRWRLIEAPATPTQATVYRLFPGGWQAVLDALGPVDPAVLCEPPSPTTGAEAATA